MNATTSPYFNATYQRGFGTYKLTGDALKSAIESALEVGYRAFDTAQMYNNEAEVGAALAQNSHSIGRDELLITTKVHPDNYSADKFMPSVKKSLADLQLDKVDVLLLHWPPADGAIEAPLDLLSQAYQAGLCAHIGVSNFTIDMMQRAAKQLDIPIACNQVEFHPLLDQHRVLSAANELNIPLSSYCSIARAKVNEFDVLHEIGRQYDKSAIQVTLRWIYQQGVVLNTMSSKQQNMANNFAIDDFSLSDDEMQSITALNPENYRIVTKEKAPWAPAWD